MGEHCFFNFSCGVIRLLSLASSSVKVSFSLIASDTPAKEVTRYIQALDALIGLNCVPKDVKFSHSQLAIFNLQFPHTATVSLEKSTLVLISFSPK